MSDLHATVLNHKITGIYANAEDAKKSARGGATVIPVSEFAAEGDGVDTYYNANSERHEFIVYKQMRSMAGRVSGVSYRVSYQLGNGVWLNGTRHRDRGDLMTDVEISARPWVT
jgi:hypothetical protein